MFYEKTHLDFAHLFQDIEQKIPQRKPYLIADERLNYGVLFDEIYRLTSVYRKLGWKTGDRVVLATGKATAFASIFLSLLRNGITAVLLNPALQHSQAQRLLKHSDIKGAIVDESLIETWELGDSFPILSIDESQHREHNLLNELLNKKRKHQNILNQSYPHILKGFAKTEGPNTLALDLDAYIIFTSGSTANPKGVQISHHSLLRHIETVIKHFSYSEKTRSLNMLPFHHGDGLNHGIMTNFLCGGTLFRPVKFNISRLDELLESISIHRMTHWVTVPSVIALVKHLGGAYTQCFEHSDFQCVISTTDALSTTLWKEFEELFHTQIVNVYGLSETVMGGFFCGPSAATRKVGTIGKPIDCQARVVNNKEQDVLEGHQGELWIKGSNVMKGYYRNPMMTERAMQKGWFKTGDIVSKDPEGFYIFEGRKKSMIVSGGVHIYPEEITEVIIGIPEVLDATTIACKASHSGEQAVACVVLQENSALTELDIIETCRKHLPKGKVPKKVFILPSLSRSSTGKILLTELRKQLDQKVKGQPINRNDIEEAVIEIAATCFSLAPEDVHLDMTPQKLAAWDSMGHIEFISQVEKYFSLSLSAREVINVHSIRDAIQLVGQSVHTGV